MIRFWIPGVILVGAAVAADTSVTFHKDVLPVLQAKCQTCHRPGEIMRTSARRAGKMITVKLACFEVTNSFT